MNYYKIVKMLKLPCHYQIVDIINIENYSTLFVFMEKRLYGKFHKQRVTIGYLIIAI